VRTPHKTPLFEMLKWVTDRIGGSQTPFILLSSTPNFAERPQAKTPLVVLQQSCHRIIMLIAPVTWHIHSLNDNIVDSCNRLQQWFQWSNYSTKGRRFLFSVETATWLEICIRVYHAVTGNILRAHTHNTSFFKVPYHITVKQKIWLSALGRMQRLDNLCLLFI